MPRSMSCARPSYAFIGALALGAASAAAAQVSSVACTVEPALAAETTLALRAWAVDSAGQAVGLPSGLQWQVSRGDVDTGVAGSAETARWTVPELPRSGILRAQLVLADGSVACAATARRVPGIRGMNPAKGAARARHFLVRGREEPRGYAALSFLLLPEPPLPAERERCLRVLSAWLRQLPPTGEMEKYVDRSQLTLFMIPLRDIPALPLEAEPSSSQAVRAAAQALLASYDHTRAQALMARMGLSGAGPGPLLVTHQGLTPGDPGAYLVEDFGRVDATIAEPWLRWSLSLVSQPRDRSTEALQRVAMTLRNVIAHVARGLPEGGGAKAHDGIRVWPAQAPAR